MRDHPRPQVTLYSATSLPIETTYCLWMKSKNPSWKGNPEEVHQLITGQHPAGLLPDLNLKKEVEDLFVDVINMDIPVSKNIQFTFMLDNLPIALREQMVRHIIGVEFGQNFGVDWIPDLEKSSWWSQSMRIMSFENIHDDEMYFTPDSVITAGSTVQQVYHDTMKGIQEAYRILVDAGIPMEDARGLLPLHSNMSISWTLNLAALSHIIGKRSCWILQYGYWSYIINGMVNELATKIHPVFRNLVLPPCFKNGKFNECVFQTENSRRVSGEDQLPVCTLYHHHNMTEEQRKEYMESNPHYDKMIQLSDKYASLWGRNPFTGA